MSKERFWLGRVDQLAVENAIIHWLFAVTVAGDDEPLSSCIPQRDREHPIDMIDKIVAVFLIKMRDDLGVGLRNELVPAFFEGLAALAIIVKLAVHHHDDRFVLTVNRLIARMQIDDREPPHSERNSVVHP